MKNLKKLAQNFKNIRTAMFLAIFALCVFFFFDICCSKSNLSGKLYHIKPENLQIQNVRKVIYIDTTKFSGIQCVDSQSDNIGYFFVEEIQEEIDTFSFIVIEDFTEPTTCTGFIDCVDNYAYLPGGFNAVNNFIAKNIKYPAGAQENGIEGTVVIRFEITKKGKVGEVEIKKNVDHVLDQEAVRVIKSLPDFVPAKHNCKTVSFWYTVPIVFKLY